MGSARASKAGLHASHHFAEAVIAIAVAAADPEHDLVFGRRWRLAFAPRRGSLQGAVLQDVRIHYSTHWRFNRALEFVAFRRWQNSHVEWAAAAETHGTHL